MDLVFLRFRGIVRSSSPMVSGQADWEISLDSAYRAIYETPENRGCQVKLLRVAFARRRSGRAQADFVQRGSSCLVVMQYCVE